MEHASVDEILTRLKNVANVSKDTDLAKLLGLSRQSIAAARMRGKIPSSWMPKASKLFNVDIGWLYYGDQKNDNISDNYNKNKETTLYDQNELGGNQCKKNEELLKKIESQRDDLFMENRELIAENRQLHREKEELLRENGELREKIARLEERKRRYEITHGLYVEDDSRV